MKKILQINVLNETGSTGRIMQNISSVLEESGRYRVITAYGYGSSKFDNSIKIGNKIDYIIHNLGSKIFCAQGLFSRWATHRFIKQIKKENIDLIHFHNIHGNYLNYPLLFKWIKENDIPVIWTLHDCWSFTGKCTYFDLCKCEQWKTGCKKCPILKEYPSSYFLDRVRQDYKNKQKAFLNIQKAYFVSPSEWLARNFKKSFLKNYPICVINNGVDISAFRKTNSDLREKYHLEEAKVVLGVATPWTSRKGYSDFIRLAKRLDEEYVVVMIGVSEKQKDELPEKIIAINKTESIDELVQWYSEADVFVNLTYEDNFPTVNLEALACNTPVITYDTGGSGEVVNELTGIKCEQGNLDLIMNAIKYICNHKKKYEKCAEYLRDNYNFATVFENYLKLYDSIFEEKNGC